MFKRRRQEYGMIVESCQQDFIMRKRGFMHESVMSKCGFISIHYPVNRCFKPNPVDVSSLSPQASVLGRKRGNFLAVGSLCSRHAQQVRCLWGRTYAASLVYIKVPSCFDGQFEVWDYSYGYANPREEPLRSDEKQTS